jgi:hypothetical protein
MILRELLFINDPQSLADKIMPHQLSFNHPIISTPDKLLTHQVIYCHARYCCHSCQRKCCQKITKNKKGSYHPNPKLQCGIASLGSSRSVAMAMKHKNLKYKALNIS